MKKKRIRHIRSKILSTQVNLRNIITNTNLSLQHGKRTIRLAEFKKVVQSFLNLAECYESLLEIYEMDADKLSKRELRILQETIAYDLTMWKDVLHDPGYSREQQAKHREHVADLKALSKKLKRMEAP